MIERIIGEIVKMDKDSVVVMIGGVGLRARVTRAVLEGIRGEGSTATIYTHLIVREDDLSLYGFASEDERHLFELLITVNGIGARLGVAILSTLSAESLRAAVTREQPEILTRVPGIGKKTAEKIVFELKSKLRITTIAELAHTSDADSEVIAALTALGYSVVEAQTAVQSIPRDGPKDVEARIMLALQYFS
jgi:Holliday junction DNA helicase RuvA